MCRLAKSAIQAAGHNMIFRLPLCMPLHADDKLTLVRIAQPLDHAIRGYSLHRQPLAHTIYALTVQGGDHDFALPCQRMKQAIAGQSNQVVGPENVLHRNLMTRSAMIVLARQFVYAVMQ